MRKLTSNGFAWVSGLTARTAPHSVDDGRFTDEEILTVVRAGEAGMKLADLCEATGITVSTYYEWKARYGGLSPQQLHERRRMARVRRQRLTMLAGAVAVAAIVVGGLMVTRRSDAAAFVPAVAANPVAPATSAVATATSPDAATPTAQADLTPSSPAATPVAAVAAPAGPATANAKPASPGVPEPAPRQAMKEPATTADPNAYSVQVAAVPDLQQARAALEKLTAAGYPAHITTKTVNRVEMYRVRVGPLDTRAAADHAAARLRQEGYASPWVTR